jgi:TadE-like protein
MNMQKKIRSGERGATLVEFSIAATVFLTSMFGVIEFGRALWTHNALSDAARRGARYAVTHSAADIEKVKNVVVFGDENGKGKPVVNELATNNVNVVYSSFALNKGTVSVSITEYQFHFVIPIVGTTIEMPEYTTTLTGESVGLKPVDK